MTARDVLLSLQNEKLLSVPYPFLLWTRLRGAGPRLKLGRYRLSLGRSSFWIIDDLIAGRTLKTSVVVPEGFASWQIADRLVEAKVCDGDQFKRVVAAEKLEGFLFPATYDFDFGIDPAQAAHLLKANFDRRWTPEMESQAASMGWGKRETVTLASILEREAVDRAELPTISSVYHKRKILLQADPTVQFALGYWKSRLTYDDYRKTISPYNTYLHAGLPPGPISNPGLDAIKAALWPAQTEYLYFVADDEGKHTFTTNYRDHTNKVNQRNKKNQGTKRIPTSKKGRS
jgi:UPF0755 protein